MSDKALCRCAAFVKSHRGPTLLVQISRQLHRGSTFRLAVISEPFSPYESYRMGQYNIHPQIRPAPKVCLHTGHDLLLFLWHLKQVVLFEFQRSRGNVCCVTPPNDVEKNSSLHFIVLWLVTQGAVYSVNGFMMKFIISHKRTAKRVNKT